MKSEKSQVEVIVDADDLQPRDVELREVNEKIHIIVCKEASISKFEWVDGKNWSDVAIKVKKQ